jgi:hypothetical protein
MHHPLPHPHLIPLCRKTPAIRRHLREYADSLSASARGDWHRFQRVNAARLDGERLWRVRNERTRLFACHWAGWHPSRTSKRWGSEGPKWLGGVPLKQ